MRGVLQVLIALGLWGSAQAEAATPRYRHVVLISIDGLHAADLATFVTTHPASTLAFLVAHGTTYTHAATPEPSDSFPGLLAMTTGGSPATTGVYYDNSYDRRLSPAGSACKVRGSAVLYNEFIDQVNSRGTSGEALIDSAKLPLDPDRGCQPVYPHSYMRVNTIFEVIHQHGGVTAWADKHPAYDVLNGPSGNGVDELFTPEIGANGEGAEVHPAGAITSSLARTIQYDGTKLQAVLNEIHGLDYAGTRRLGMPMLLGMNFQALNVAEKLPEGGYLDHGARPSAMVVQALSSVDQALGDIISALRSEGLLGQTLVVISAKSGNGPLDRQSLRLIDKGLIPQKLQSLWPGCIAHVTADDIMLIWLKQPSLASRARRALLAEAGQLGIEHVYPGFPGEGSRFLINRTPDLTIIPHGGVIYASSHALKIAEHGGLSIDDIHVGLLLSAPGGGMRQDTVASPVSTQQIAPTILEALGLSANELEAVRLEHTEPLPL